MNPGGVDNGGCRGCVVGVAIPFTLVLVLANMLRERKKDRYMQSHNEKHTN